MSLDKFIRNRRMLRSVGRVEPHLVPQEEEEELEDPIPRDEGEEVLQNSGRFTDEEIRARRQILDNAVGALYPASTTLRRLMKRAEDILAEHNHSAEPIPRDVTEKALRATGFTDDEILRHREIAERPKVGQAKAMVQDEQFLQRVKNALRCAEAFRAVRGRFETVDEYKRWIQQAYATDQKEYDGLNFIRKKLREAPDTTEYADAANALWNGYPRARTESATRLATKLFKRMVDDPALSNAFDPLADKSGSTTATP